MIQEALCNVDRRRDYVIDVIVAQTTSPKEVTHMFKKVDPLN